MDLISVEDLTPLEFADLLCDVIGSAGFQVDKSRTIPLKIGNDLVEWPYPSVVIATRASQEYVLVTRVGATAEIPGYLAKYLHGTRRNLPGSAVYIVCRESVADGYRSLCALYGLGLVSCSLSVQAASFLLEPNAGVDISRAFDSRVDRVLERVETAFAERLQNVDKNALRFKKEAKRFALYDRSAEFDLEKTKIVAERDDLRARCEYARRSKSLEELGDLLIAVEELK